ncbi:glucose-6-phosphate dehydrogenase [Candidatus Curtissbacteria bacterium RIFCSPHIGHO2_12_41_11]|uniref:Glucose-6-phosphate 1-dehydrogenase n=2 Tax=Candidatus Curtissiibacteriota TaxID=1752717 RepID=A0A1F5HV48_9BACT|nr:MAG: glucose-6-phosphate dehydrogenase [Candidatus Curtissbacteria bacterium RIFCSPHIGHO2_12_41_11]OGE07865.1 MAG: glucose-6-phosphate dehydrogenase [Candidatus Curtissbacteria bacterium RIFCSPLOWO2_02_41_11]
MSKQPASPGGGQGGPTAIVIAGATGDLARKRIFPALFELFTNNLLPQKLKIIAAARTKHTDKSFREVLNETLSRKNEEFLKLIDYLSLDVAQNINLANLSKHIEQFEKITNSCTQRIFYMAIAPTILEKAVENLASNNLHLGCPIHHQQNTKSRIIIEKPYGTDLKSAQSLGQKLLQYFNEDQIYRIDHYLGKETVQNIFAFRFGNDIFEPIWNKDFIDHVQITTAEGIGVEKRGEFYDKTGALRDITQNHLLQLLTLTAMEEPEKFETESIRKKKLEILSSIKELTFDEIPKFSVRGQYEGYLAEEKIASNSKTETYALIKLFIKNQRWQGIPFYLRTGKKLMGKVTSIIIQFKESGHKLYKNFQDTIPNHITIQIQPNEGIGIRLAAKKPGLTTQLEPVDMEFCYKTSFDTPQPDAYERLILDVILGDQSLFISQEEVEASWKIIDPIEEVWQSSKSKLTLYKPGTWGPSQADDLIKADSRHWLAPLLTICKI